jgi:tRNA threonylcarbamoyladenosine biosynthesis protein TsaE
MRLTRAVATAEDMEALGAALARGLRAGQVIFFHGDLGSGKTTLIRGMLHAIGHRGAVKSPTYTLVESYRLAGREVFHFDLYRLNDAEELEFLGIRDYLQGQGICLVEWAERGKGHLPPPDVDVFIEREEDRRTVQVHSHTDKGAALLDGLA